MPEVAEIGEPPRRPIEVAASIGIGRERADVELVDDEVVPAGHGHGVVAPLERGRVVDDRITDRVRDLPSVRVHARQELAAFRLDGEPILHPGPDTRDVRRPGVRGAVVVAGQGGGRLRPVIERPADVDRLGVRCPDPERGPAIEWERAHAGPA